MAEEQARILLELGYDKQSVQRTLDQLARDLKRAEQVAQRRVGEGSVSQKDIAQARADIRRLDSEAKRVQRDVMARNVELRRQEIQSSLNRLPRPRSKDDVLNIAGLSPERLKLVNEELDRAGGSVSDIERALKRVDFPDTEAKAFAISIREAKNEAEAMRARAFEGFTRLRRLSEQGVRLAEVGFILGGVGAGITGGAALAARGYVERYRGMEEAANRFTQAQFRQEEAMTRVGRVAATALSPALEEIGRLTEGLARIAERNPNLVRGIVDVGTGLALAGTAMVLVGRLTSIYARLRLVLEGGDRGEGLVKKLAPLVGPGLVVAGGAALGLAAINAIEPLREAADLTKDGFVDLNDVLKLIRMAIAVLADAVVKAGRTLNDLVSIVNLVGTAIKGAFDRLGLIIGAAADEIFSKIKIAIQDAAIKALPEGTRLRKEAEKEFRGTPEEREALRQQLFAAYGEAGMNVRTTEQATQLEQQFTRFLSDMDKMSKQEIELELRRLKFAQDFLKSEAETADTAAEIAAKHDKNAQILDDIEKQLGPILDDFVETGKLPKQVEDTWNNLRAKLEGALGGGPGGGATTPAGFSPEGFQAFMEFRRAEADALRQQSQQRIDAERAFNRERLQAEREHREQQRQDLLEYQRKTRDMTEQYYFDQEKALRDFERNEAEIKAKADFEALQRERDLEFRLFELAAARDVAGFVEARKRAQLDEEQRQRQADFEGDERARRFQVEDDERTRRFNFDMERTRREFDEQQRDKERQFQIERANRRREFEEQLYQMRLEAQRAREARLRDFALQLSDLEANIAGLRSMRNAFYAEQIIAYQNFINGQRNTLQGALQSVYSGGVTKPAPTYTPTPARQAPVQMRNPFVFAPFQEGGPIRETGPILAHAGEFMLRKDLAPFGPMLESGNFMTAPNKIINVTISGNAIGGAVSQSELEAFGNGIVAEIEAARV